MGRNSKARNAENNQKDPFLEFAQFLRTKHGIEWRTGIAGGERVEYFRGKDFASFLKENSDKMEALPGIEPLKPGRSAGMQVEEVYYQMARRRLMIRAERLHKKPKPGRKKLVKWPKKLIYTQEQMLDDDSFYCWTFDRPASPWLWLGSALMALFVFAMCLFPLAPYSIKISVVYLSMGLLGLILGILLVRSMVFSLVWIVLGRHFWILPNITSEELGIMDSFKPLYAFTLGEDGKELPAPHWFQRLVFGIVVGLSSYALHQYAPDGASVKTNLGKAHDSILAALNLHDPGRMKIGESVNPAANATDALLNQTANVSEGSWGSDDVMAADQEDEYVTEPLEGDEGGDEDDKSDMEVDLDANNLEEPETKGATSEEKQEAEL